MAERGARQDGREGSEVGWERGGRGNELRENEQKRKEGENVLTC